ncbi:hypothetical protein MBLNU459_g0502t1 [Dothideomycetes sp. NU459]
MIAPAAKEPNLRKRQQTHPTGPPAWLTLPHSPITTSDLGDEDGSLETSFLIAGPTTLATTFTLGQSSNPSSTDLTSSPSPTSAAAAAASVAASSSDVTSDAAATTATDSAGSIITSVLTFQPTKPAWLTESTYSSITLPTSSSSSSGSSPLPDISPPSSDRSDHAHAAVIAGVVVPLLVALIAGLLVLFCLRRRRRRTSNAAFQPMAEAKEQKAAAKRSSSVPGTSPDMRRPQQPHILTSAQNTSYFTGLDTFSMHSAEPQDAPLRASQDPPPPYRPRSTFSHGGAPSFVSELATPAAPVVLHSHEPVSPLTPLREDVPAVVVAAAAQSSPFDDPPVVVRTPSSRSITSTLYSSNASVVEARPARMSVGGAHMVGGLHGAERSPFADPESGAEA